MAAYQLYPTGVTVREDDELLSLSTCEYSSTNGRLIVLVYAAECDEYHSLGKLYKSTNLDEILARYREDMTKEEGEQTGIEIARQIIEKTSDFVDGYYFSFPFNRVHMLAKILMK